jgi:hypothetical protein
VQVQKAYLFKVKRPEAIKEKDDYFEIVGSLSTEEAYGPPGLFGCSMKGF